MLRSNNRGIGAFSNHVFGVVPSNAFSFADDDPGDGGAVVATEPATATPPEPETFSATDYNTKVAEGTRYHKRAQTAEAELAKIKKNVMSDEDIAELAASRIAKEQEAQAELESKGEFDQIVNVNREKHAAELQSRDVEAGKLKEIVRKKAVSDALTTSLAKHGVKYIEDAVILLSSQVAIEFAEDMSDYSVNVVNPDGSIHLDPEAEVAQSITIDQYVEGWLGTHPNFLPPSGDTGTGRHPGGAGAPSGVTRDQLGIDLEKNDAFLQKEGFKTFLNQK